MKLKNKKVRTSLVSKLLISVMAIVGIIFAIIAFILSATVRNYYTGYRNEKINQVNMIIGQAVNVYVSEGSQSFDVTNSTAGLDQLNTILQFSKNFLDAKIIVLNSQDDVIAVSDSSDNNLKFTKITQIGGEAINNKSIMSFDKGGYNYYYKPIYYQNYLNGSIIIETPLSEINSMLNKIYLIIWIFVIIALIILSIVIYTVCKKFIIDPIESLNEASQKIAKGDVGERVNITSNDELGELAASFNFMAEAIEKVETNRREFISNVSHELRSPMTSIRGFIAGILDGIIPPDKEHFYLQKVYEETERLTRLITDLLDISAMQTGKLKFNFSKVDINEIIKTSAVNLEPKILDKKLHVSITLEGDYLYVKADRDKLIQVCTNLIDNSVKYCTEGGNIEIMTKSKGNRVVVVIYNDGVPLEEDTLRHIWERFYKADKSRTNKESTGLGLSIVRNIILSHEEEVWVENSEDGKGVKFAFTLTKMD